MPRWYIVNFSETLPLRPSSFRFGVLPPLGDALSFPVLIFYQGKLYDPAVLDPKDPLSLPFAHDLDFRFAFFISFQTLLTSKPLILI